VKPISIGFFISAESGEGLFLVKKFPHAGVFGIAHIMEQRNFVRVDAEGSVPGFQSLDWS
jgi:hypothetical protein